MNRLSTARDALFAELFGEADRLLAEVTRLSGKVEEAGTRVETLVSQLDASAERYEMVLTSVTQQAQTSAVDYVVRRTNEQAASIAQSHADTIQAAARASIEGETGRLFAQINRRLLNLADQQSSKSLYARWAAYAATAVLSGAVTSWITVLWMSK